MFLDEFDHIIKISIHALREEGDTSSGRAGTSMTDFYPRPPRGGRPAEKSSTSSSCNFYPRPPRGGRHVSDLLDELPNRISIHALREEGDSTP